jgi:pimeloyl-ACP methyl ester carboxylesterase
MRAWGDNGALNRVRGPLPDMRSPMPTSRLPSTIATLADVSALEGASCRTHTPCGDDRMLWHEWGDGPAIVLLHGGSGSWTHWVRNIAPLAAAGRRVLVPDMPGFGDSASPPQGHDADVLPAWILRGMDTLAPGERFDLVGFSFGGLVAGLLAAAAPDRVRRLVLVGAPALTNDLGPPLDLRPWSHLPHGGPEREAVHRHNLGALMLSRPRSIDPLAVALHAANVERDRMRRRRLMLTDVLRRTLPGIACPVSGIWGAEDVLYRGRAETVREALAEAPHLRSLVFVPQAGHWVQYEEPGVFDAALADALESRAGE